jgi:hypothetical protein
MVDCPVRGEALRLQDLTAGAETEMRPAAAARIRLWAEPQENGSVDNPCSSKREIAQARRNF